MRNAYKYFTAKSEGKKPLGGRRRKEKSNNIINAKETGYEAVD
jgi:hypothetical protein